MAWLAVGLTAGYGVGCLVLAKRLLSPGRFVPVTPPFALSVNIPHQPFPIPAWTSKGLGKSEKVFVFAHGIKANRGVWKAAMEDVIKAGHGAVAIALPGHDANLEPMTTVGPKEAEAVLTSAHWVRKQNPAAKIILVGVSMGGAACWLAAERDPTLADAIVTESAFTRLDEAMGRWFDRALPYGSTLLAPIGWFAQNIAGISVSEVNPIEGARKWSGKPALIITAQDDDLILAVHGQRLKDALKCDSWEVRACAHSSCYATARKEYSRRLLEIASRL